MKKLESTIEYEMSEEVNKVYNDFWKNIIERDGKVDMDAVKCELHDYSILLNNVPSVYCHVTGSRISKPNTFAFEVEQAADEYYQDLYDGIHKEEIDELKKELKKANVTIKKLKNKLKIASVHDNLVKNKRDDNHYDVK